MKRISTAQMVTQYIRTYTLGSEWVVIYFPNEASVSLEELNAIIGYAAYIMPLQDDEIYFVELTNKRNVNLPEIIKAFAQHRVTCEVWKFGKKVL